MTARAKGKEPHDKNSDHSVEELSRCQTTVVGPEGKEINKYSNVFLHPPSNLLSNPWVHFNLKSEDDRAWVMQSTEDCILAFRTWQRSKGRIT